MRFNFLITILSFFVATGCDKDELSAINFNPAETFRVVNAEETMPVWVYGKADANRIILAVHGGPGSDVLDFRNYQNGIAFKQIENTYLIAYWQQRASGQSSGSDNTNYFNINQYVADLDKVVDELKSRYPNKDIVLLGHSWGGTLTSTYLKDATRRAKIKAWIDAAGAHNGTTLSQTTIADINAEANARIAANENVAYWQNVKQQLISSPNTANSLAYSVTEKIPEVTVKVNNSDFKYTNRAITSNGKLFPEILATNNNSFLNQFNFKTLLIWGKYDFAVSKTYRNEALSNLPTANVTSIEFPASGHYMMFHEPNLFATSVINFVNTL